MQQRSSFSCFREGTILFSIVYVWNASADGSMYESMRGRIPVCICLHLKYDQSLIHNLIMININQLNRDNLSTLWSTLHLRNTTLCFKRKWMLVMILLLSYQFVSLKQAQGNHMPFITQWCGKLSPEGQWKISVCMFCLLECVVLDALPWASVLWPCFHNAPVTICDIFLRTHQTTTLLIYSMYVYSLLSYQVRLLHMQCQAHFYFLWGVLINHNAGPRTSFHSKFFLLTEKCWFSHVAQSFCVWHKYICFSL